MGARVNPYTVKSDWIDPDDAQAHFQASALTNQNVEEAFTSVAELAYDHHMKTAAEALKANQMGEAVNLSAIRSTNFKLGGPSGLDQQAKQQS